MIYRSRRRANRTRPVFKDQRKPIGRSFTIGVRVTAAVLCPFLLAACTGPQSVFGGAGREALAIESLIVVTAIGAACIWFLITSLLVYASRVRRHRFTEEKAQRFITWGGVVGPAALLFVLVSYAVWSMPATRPWFERQQADLEIEVTGEQYWWRIRYLDRSGDVAFETANELKLPVDRRIRVSVQANDVIHSFWIPALGGKMDMIPGRTNTLWLEPTRIGSYRGPCAEFCGTSHALMTLTAIVMPRDEFQAWKQGRTHPTPPSAHAGAAFRRHGCPACHAVDGTDATGLVGPNLTAFKERNRMGAGAVANSRENLLRFIRDPGAVKPGAQMPAFPMIPDGELKTIVDYLAGDP